MDFGALADDEDLPWAEVDDRAWAAVDIPRRWLDGALDQVHEGLAVVGGLRGAQRVAAEAGTRSSPETTRRLHSACGKCGPRRGEPLGKDFALRRLKTSRLFGAGGRFGIVWRDGARLDFELPRDHAGQAIESSPDLRLQPVSIAYVELLGVR